MILIIARIIVRCEIIRFNNVIEIGRIARGRARVNHTDRLSFSFTSFNSLSFTKVSLFMKLLKSALLQKRHIYIPILQIDIPNSLDVSKA